MPVPVNGRRPRLSFGGQHLAVVWAVLLGGWGFFWRCGRHGRFRSRFLQRCRSWP